MDGDWKVYWATTCQYFDAAKNFMMMVSSGHNSMNHRTIETLKISQVILFNTTVNRVGCKGLVRDHEGNWFGGFAKKIGNYYVLLADLWDVFKGLKLLKEIGLEAIEINLGSQIVMDIVKDKK